MKKLFFLTLWLTLCGSSMAQTIDKVQYRITYDTKCVDDTTERDSFGGYVYGTDEMALDIGSKVSKFYSMLSARYNKWVADNIKRGGEADPNNPQPPGAWITSIFFHNYPEGKDNTLSDEYYSLYRIEELASTPDWDILSDTCTILGYHCTKAETNYKGRHWIAWYTEDIPIDQGPWFLCGLPGLILKANDVYDQWIFKAVGMKQIDGKEDITLGKWKKYDPINKTKYYQWRRTATREDMLKARNATSTTTFTYVKPNGEEYTPEEYHDEFGKPDPFNPLDLSE